MALICLQKKVCETWRLTDIHDCDKPSQSTGQRESLNFRTVTECVEANWIYEVLIRIQTRPHKKTCYLSF